MKKILSFILIVVSAFVLMGCGNTTKKVTSEYEVKSIAELRAQAKVEVKFRIPLGSAIQEVIKEMIDDFTVEYPNISITLDYIGGYDEMKKQTIYDINGGVVPTMILGYPDHFAEYLISGSIISLDKFINAEDPVIGYTEDELNDFVVDYVNENRQFDKNNTYKGLPFNKSTEVMFYNKDFFDQFELEVPKTWDELDALSEEIYDIVATLEDDTYTWLPKIKTNLAAETFIPMMYDSGGNLFTTAIHQFNGNYTESVYKGTGALDLQRGNLKFVNDDNALAAFTYLQSLANKGVFNLPTLFEGNYGSNFFIAGQTVLNVGSTGGASHYTGAKSKIGVAPIPYKDEEHKYVIQQGTNFAIFSQATDIEKLAAWLFIKHCLTTDNTVFFATQTGYLPVRKSAYETDEYKDFLKNENDLVVKIHKAAAEYSESWHFFVDPAWSGSNAIREEVEIAANEILVSNMNVKKSFEDAKNRYGK